MRRTSLFIVGLYVAVVIAVPVDTLPAQTKKADAKASREKAALMFANRHHPELAELLKRLKATDTKAFDAAVRDVSQSRERLSRLEVQDPERHELALQVWTLDSRIRLLAARSTMSDDPSIDERLRELLRERRQARLSLLRFERQRLKARIDRIEGQIEHLERNGDDAVENDLARIKRAVTVNRTRKRPANRLGEEVENKKSNSDLNAPSKDKRKPITDRDNGDESARGLSKDGDKTERKLTPANSDRMKSSDRDQSTSVD